MAVCRWGALLALVSVACAPGVAFGAVRADRDHDKVFDTLESSLGEGGRKAVLVSLREPATPALLERIERAVGNLGATTRLRLVDAFAARATPGQIRALARRSDVAHVEDDAVAIPFGVSAQTSFGIARARMELPDLDGRGLVAAVVDTGVDTTMPDLAGGKVIAFKDLVNGREAPYDDNAHGSLVSSILAGSGASGPEGRGVAPAASLVSIKVVDAFGQSSLGKIAESVQWAVEHRDAYGINAINLSIGDPNGCGDGTDVASQAVDAAVAAGIVVVAAAGNSGPSRCTIKSPAAAESALTVGAMADTGAGGFSGAWFSSRGPTADGRVKPDVSAPGVDVVISSPGGGTVEGSGTSAAAPFVTGTALLMLQTQPSLAPAAVKDLITRTAVDWGPPGRDSDYGHGRLDAYAALAAANAPLAAPPAVPAHRSWTGSLAAGESVSYALDVAGGRFPLALTLNAPSAGFRVGLHNAAGEPVGTMTVQPAPSRQGDITLVAPVAGRHTATVTALTDSGAYALDVSGDLAPIDGTAPALTLDTVAQAEFGGAAGTALGDFPGVVTRVWQDGDVVHRDGVVPLFGRWSVPLALPDGVYTVEAEQGDAAGNVARTDRRPLIVDTLAPAVAISGGPSGLTLSASEPGVAFECRLDGAAWEACANTVSFPNLPPGRHVFEARATDPAGNTGAAARREWTVEPDATPMPTAVPTSTPTSTRIPASLPATPTAAATATPVPTPGALRIALAVPRQRLGTVLRRGLAVTVTCSCRTTITVTFGKRTLTRRGLTGTTRITLPAALRRSLARARSAKLTLKASAKGAPTVTRRVTLKR